MMNLKMKSYVVVMLLAFFFIYHVICLQRLFLSLIMPENFPTYNTITPFKPLVSVVIVMDPSDMINDGLKGQSTLLMAWNCYCMRHGYRLFYAPRVPTSNIAKESMTDSFADRANQNAFYQGRLMLWRNYLRLTDILIVMDSDSLVVHHETRLTDFISSSDDHVALQQRQNKGICAGAMMIRNTPQGRAFLDMWYEDASPHIDMDNGRLHSQVLRRYLNSSLGEKLVSPEVALTLTAVDAAARRNFRSYFKLMKLMGENIGYSYKIVRFDGIVIYPAFGGFFRDFGFAQQPGINFWNELPFNCILDTDVIVHSKTSGPLVMEEDWACSLKSDAPFGFTFPTCNISSQLWYQCQMTRQDRAALVGSHTCQENRKGPCNASVTNLTEWDQLCSQILGLKGG